MCGQRTKKNSLGKFCILQMLHLTIMPENLETQRKRLRAFPSTVRNTAHRNSRFDPPFKTHLERKKNKVRAARHNPNSPALRIWVLVCHFLILFVHVGQVRHDDSRWLSYGGFQKCGYTKMDVVWGKILLRWMIRGYPYCRNPPHCSYDSPLNHHFPMFFSMCFHCFTI